MDDIRLNALKTKASEGGIIIVAGAPIKIEDALYIGAFIFLPGGDTVIYTKQNLHEGEEKYFCA